VHFTCHGHTDPDHYLQLGTPFDGLFARFAPDNVIRLPHLAGGVVFANACSSGAVTPFLGKLRSFGWEFYKKGAAAFIGTLGLVPVEDAMALAEHFYRKLLAGGTVGESLQIAKDSSDQSNPFWLLYALYGDPFARKVPGSGALKYQSAHQQLSVVVTENPP
jgi:hypothetical protein